MKGISDSTKYYVYTWHTVLSAKIEQQIVSDARFEIKPFARLFSTFTNRQMQFRTAAAKYATKNR